MSESKLEQMPNLGPTLAEELRQAGIPTLDALRQLGALAAWHRIRRVNPERGCNSSLLALEGAMRRSPLDPAFGRGTKPSRRRSPEENTVSSLSVLGVDNVLFPAGDLAEAIEFYQGRLGLPLAFHVPEAKIAGFRVGEEALGLLVRSGAVRGDRANVEKAPRGGTRAASATPHRPPT